MAEQAQTGLQGLREVGAAWLKTLPAETQRTEQGKVGNTLVPQPATLDMN